jgi:hypothetical protein
MVQPNTSLRPVAAPAPRTVKITVEQARALTAYLQNRPFGEVYNAIGWLSAAITEEEKVYINGERDRARAQLLAEARAAEGADKDLETEPESEFERARKRAENGEPPHIPTNGNGKKR